MDSACAAVSTAANIATILGLLLIFWAIGATQRAAKNHVLAHLAAVRVWASGPNGDGWSESDVSKATLLKWHDPRNSQIRLDSGHSLPQLNLLQYALVPRDLAAAFVALAESINGFNDYLARQGAFAASDVVIAASIATKLDAAIRSVLGASRGDLDSPPPDDLTQPEFANIIDSANLTEQEFQVARFLATKLQALHITFIGNRTGRGVHRHLRDLEDILQREGWL